MAYENTLVAVSKSQEAIRKLILSNGGSAIGFLSQSPMEGFQAHVAIDGKTYLIRIVAQVKEVAQRKRRNRFSTPTDAQDKEARRVWRVLYYHMKSLFEAAASGVIELREMLLPYIVANDGKTVAEHLLPKLDQALAGRPERLLPAPKE